MTDNLNKKKCCGEIDLSNLGRCKFCVTLAVILTLVCWVGYVLINKYFSIYWLSLIVFVFACLFSLLLLAHTIAFFTNKEEKE
jgi:hypothetical protein